MYFDSEAWIEEMESMQDVEEKPFSFEDFKECEIIGVTERELKGDL